jgi:hypothetical protein
MGVGGESPSLKGNSGMALFNPILLYQWRGLDLRKRMQHGVVHHMSGEPVLRAGLRLRAWDSPRSLGMGAMTAKARRQLCTECSPTVHLLSSSSSDSVRTQNGR